MIVVFIRYRLNPLKLALFETYAKKWLAIIPACGGDLVGHYLPHEGTNYEAFGLVRFPSLAGYEEYRIRLRADEAGKANFEFAQREGCILQEDRAFLREVTA